MGSRGDSGPFVHPGLAVAIDHWKGRKVISTRRLKDGEIILIDTPYALVPAMMPDEPPFHICSRHECNRRIQPQGEGISCSEGCAKEVLWCNTRCRQNDEARHRLECSWLKRRSAEIRAKQGESNFGLLWLIVRILVQRHVGHEDSGSTENTDERDEPASHFHRRGWDSVWNLQGSQKDFSAEQLGQWRQFAETYLANGALSIHVSAQDVVDLFCKLETNSFGLYPGATGEYPVESFTSRGEYYGAGIYPTAAMFNHTCCPNVLHKLDSNGRRIFEANRDIEPDEECCISYFDLVEFSDTTARQGEMARSWNFMCNCQRCVEEGEFEVPHFLKEMDF